MKPLVEITIKGKKITDNLMARFDSLQLVDDTSNKADSLTITLTDQKPAITLPKQGENMTVRIGYQGANKYLRGEYTLDEIELAGPPAQMVLIAKAADVRKSMKQKRDFSWKNVSLGDIVSTIAERYSLTPKTGADYASIQFAQLTQDKESDLAFLQRLAKEYDALAQPKNGYLLFVKRGTGKSATGKTLGTLKLTPPDVTRWDVSVTDRKNYAAVTANWQNLETGELVKELVGEGEPVYVLPGTFPDADRATAAAVAKYDELLRGKGGLSLSMPGKPELAAEMILNLAGFRDGVDGEWVIKQVSHVIDRAGYRCNVRGERPGRK
ncbi:phage late control D family protein [Emcibacter sp.]|uniref:phage late control D family protein n=1 Tax=Emcibacter sp. TaxID=1979954 RepID=UPI002AA6CBFA|nr:contractile injection system protein, VgrG/Pvc8 family [Emcibacter sp.]